MCLKPAVHGDPHPALRLRVAHALEEEIRIATEIVAVRE